MLLQVYIRQSAICCLFLYKSLRMSPYLPPCMHMRQVVFLSLSMIVFLFACLSVYSRSCFLCLSVTLLRFASLFWPIYIFLPFYVPLCLYQQPLWQYVHFFVCLSACHPAYLSGKSACLPCYVKSFKLCVLSVTATSFNCRKSFPKACVQNAQISKG